MSALVVTDCAGHHDGGKGLGGADAALTAHSHGQRRTIITRSTIITAPPHTPPPTAFQSAAANAGASWSTHLHAGPRHPTYYGMVSRVRRRWPVRAEG